MKRIWLYTLIFMASLICFAQISTIDSLRKELYSMPTKDTSYVLLLNDLVNATSKVDLIEAIRLGRESVDIANSLSDELVTAKSKFYLANALLQKGEDEEAYNLYMEIKPLFEQKAKPQFTMKLFNNLSAYFGRINQRESKMKFALKSDSIAEKIGDRSHQIYTSYNIGQTFLGLFQFEEAYKYIQKATHLAKKENDQYLLANCYKLLSDYYSAIENFSMAVLTIDSAKTIAESNGLGNQSLQINLYLSSGKIHERTGFYEKAIMEYRKASDIAEEINNEYMLPYIYTYISHSYMLLGDSTGRADNYDQALLYALKLKKFENEYNSFDFDDNLYTSLANIYARKDRYREAFKALEIARNARDSLNETDLNSKIADLKEKYETEKKEQQLTLQDQKIKIQQAEISQQTLIKNSLLVGIAILGLIVGLIYRSERLKTRKNKQIEALLKEIHHRVKNNLQVISSLLNMQSREVEDQNILNTIKEGQNRVKAMSLIHQKLYQNDNVTEIDFEEYAKDLCKQLSSVFSKPNQKIENQILSNKIKLDVDTAIPLGLILNELISNAYKYAFEGKQEGRIEVVLDRIQKGEMVLKVKDNGKGIPADFNVKEAKSLGLKLVNILTRQLKGQLNYSTENGTEFLINFKELVGVKH